MEARSIALPERPVDRPALRTLAVALVRTALLTGVYVAAGKAAFALAFVHTSIAPVWPPSGIVLAAVLLWGRPAVSGGAAGGVPVQTPPRRCRCGSAPSRVVNCS
jgi:hypothetical protein